MDRAVASMSTGGYNIQAKQTSNSVSGNDFDNTKTEGSRLHLPAVNISNLPTLHLCQILSEEQCGKTKATQSFKDRRVSFSSSFFTLRGEPSISDLTSTGPSPSPFEEPFEMNPALIYECISLCTYQRCPLWHHPVPEHVTYIPVSKD